MASRLDTDLATKSAYHLVNNGIMLAKTTPTMQQDKLKRVIGKKRKRKKKDIHIDLVS